MSGGDALPGGLARGHHDAQEGEAGEATTTAENSQGQTAEAAMVDESTLTRRQKRLLRRQQMQQEPFLPWLR